MKPLTLQHALENKFTGIDCVRYFKPDWSDEECYIFLLHDSSFPCPLYNLITELNQNFIK